MDLEETWNNYKSILSAIASTEPNAVQKLLDEIRAPTEDAKNSVKLTQLLELVIELQKFDVLSALLQHGVRAKSMADTPKRSLLQRAVISGNVSLISELLSHGINWRVVDKDGNTLLHLAFMNKDEEWKEAKMYRKNFLKNQTDNLIVDILKSLLNVSLDVNSMNNENFSPLALAIKDRLKATTEFLVSKGATLKIFGNTVSHHLIKEEITLISKPEEYGPWLRQTNMEFMNWWFSLKLDIHIRNNRGETPLQACAKPDLKPVYTTLRKYVDYVNVENDSKQSPLHCLIESTKGLTNQHDIDKARSFVKKLVEEGMSVDKADRNGNTPFHLAASLKTPTIMEVILDKFTNVKVWNNMAETVLHPVVRNCSSEHSETYVKIIRELITKGANVNKQNSYGNTPLHLACTRNSLLHQDVIKLLVEHGCDVNRPNDKGATPLSTAIDADCPTVAQLLIDLGADVHWREKETNYTALHKAAKMYQTELMTKLIKAGADVDAKDRKGMTPLHLLAAVPGYTLTLQSPIVPMGVLLNNFADVDARDERNWTPLRTALETHNYYSAARVQTLLQFGAKIRPEYKNVMRVLRQPNDQTKLTFNSFLYSMRLAGFKIEPFDEIVDAERLINDQTKVKYQTELEKMKTTIIKDNVSVYEILHMEVKTRCRFMRDPKFKELRADYQAFRRQFPLFSIFITARYWTAETRDKLERSAGKAWLKLGDESLKGSLLDRVFTYLEDGDLRMLIQASKLQ